MTLLLTEIVFGANTVNGEFFFPISCFEHTNTEEVVNEADVADMADVSSDEEEDDIVM